MIMARIAMLKNLFLFLLLPVCHGQEYPFRNTSLTFEDRVKVREQGLLGTANYISIASLCS